MIEHVAAFGMTMTMIYALIGIGVSAFVWMLVGRDEHGKPRRQVLEAAILSVVLWPLFVILVCHHWSDDE